MSAPSQRTSARIAWEVETSVVTDLSPLSGPLPIEEFAEPYRYRSVPDRFDFDASALDAYYADWDFMDERIDALIRT